MASGISLVSFNSRGLDGMHQRSYSVSSADQWADATVIANSGVSTGEQEGSANAASATLGPHAQLRLQAQCPSMQLREGAYHFTTDDVCVCGTFTSFDTI